MKENETEKKTVYAVQEEKVMLQGVDEKVREELVFKLKDIVSCLNFCDYEIDLLKKKISDSINLLDR